MPSLPIHTEEGFPRVAITGTGILTSMGHGWRENADGFRIGRLALRKVTLFDASRQRVDRAGEVLLPNSLPESLLPSRQARRIDRASALLLHAAAEAWCAAGLALGAWKGRVVPLVLGTSAGAMAVGEEYYKHAVTHPASRRRQLTRIQQYQVQTQALRVTAALGVRGPVTIIANACASGANSIGHAFEQLRYGRAEVALAGGYDALCEMVFAGFDSLQALSTDLPRPFDAHRDGLALGEGAAIFVMETFEHALRRGAEILAEIRGYGAATDLHHLTQPHPQGDAAVLSMSRACESAGVRPADIGYINSHGTGTPLNDVAEANAITRWAGPEIASKIALSSTKASIGHLLGGAGSVEAAICVMALREGWLPPTTTIRTPDPACAADLVREPRDQKIDCALTNSFGFGGSNATVILARPEWNPERSCTSRAAPKARPSSVGGGEVSISGVGVVSPAGWGLAPFLAALESGQPLPVMRDRRAEGALEVTARAVPPPAAPLACLRDARLRRVSPISRFAAFAAVEALGEVILAKVKVGEFRLAVIFSVLNGCVQYSRRFYAEVLADPKTASPILFPETVFNAPASHLSAMFGSAEINYSVLGDSAAYLSALRLGQAWLEDDKADGVLVVAAEELDWVSSEAAILTDSTLIPAEGAAALLLTRGGEGPRLRWRGQPVLFGPDCSRADAAGIARRENLPEALPDSALLLPGFTLSSPSHAAERKAWADWAGPMRMVGEIMGEGLGVSAAWQCVAATAAARENVPAIVSAVGGNEFADCVLVV